MNKISTELREKLKNSQEKINFLRENKKRVEWAIIAGWKRPNIAGPWKMMRGVDDSPISW
ncbi:hypothetical protein [endosymbiont GvMRE of Glomus versiforme]|uniref:hypothetical protein n=1 Tax=endosymbiont GvMRE of Glomus versiforme TaxID=2039283 RepID=UPI0015591FA5|nr:hypothetical protein [endosymbiont GvMRE of Glomus versiforme]